MEENLRIIISGGGTGGHIFPAVSIANAIKEQHPEAEILFVGAEGRMEMHRVPAAGYPIKGLPVAGFDRKNLLKIYPFFTNWQRASGKHANNQRIPSSCSSRSRWICQRPYIESSRYDGNPHLVARAEFLCRSYE